MITLLFIFLTLNVMLPASLFVYYYARYSPWRSHGLGKAMMLQVASVLAMASISLSRLIFEPSPWLWAAQIVILVGAAFAFWVIFAVLRDVQKTGRILLVEADKIKIITPKEDSNA